VQSRLATVPKGLIAILIPLIGLAVSPWHNLEPVSLPKLFILTLVLGLLLFFQFLTNQPVSLQLDLFNVALGLGFFLILVNLIENNQFLSERFFGVTGRSAGALLFISLLILILMTRSISPISLTLILISIKAAMVIVVLYFFVQLIGYDKAQWIDTYGGVPSSTLGNPNYVSALVGIGSSITLPYLFARKTRISLRFLLFVCLCVELYVLYASNSIQGFVILSFSLTFFFLSLIKNSLFAQIKNWLKFLKILTMSFLLILMLALIQFRDLLDLPSSYKARIDYWYAAMRMIKDSPLTGQGFDYFSESYFLFRGQDAADSAPGLFSDSAHNYFLDYGAFGGVPLLLAFLIPTLLVLTRTLYFCFNFPLKTNGEPNLDLATLGCVLAWWGFLIQSLINPISYGLIVPSAILTGVLYAILPSSFDKFNSVGNWSRVKKAFNFKYYLKLSRTSYLLLRITGLALAVSIPILGAQPIIADAKFRDAIEQGNGEEVLRLSITEPKNFLRMETASRIFLQNNYPDLALRVTRIMVKENPGNIRGWRLLNTNPNATTDEKIKSRTNMLKLDPLNNQLRMEFSQSP
jgi:O-antigen ligase